MKFKYLNTQNIETEKLVEYSNYQAKERLEDEKFVILSSENLLLLTLRHSEDKLLPKLFEDPKSYFGSIIQILEGNLFCISEDDFREMVIADMEKNWIDVWEYVISDLLFDVEMVVDGANTKMV